MKKTTKVELGKVRALMDQIDAERRARFLRDEQNKSRLSVASPSEVSRWDRLMKMFGRGD